MRKIASFIALLLIPFAVSAQHYFQAGLRVGVASWDALTNYVSPAPNIHAGLELSYAYRSPYIIGFRTGFVIDHHRTAFSKINYEDSYQTTEVENQLMQIDYTIGRLNERYAFWSVGVPVQLSLSWSDVSFVLGPKFVFPLSATYHETADDAALSVYYPTYDNRVYESYPLAASRSFSESNSGSLVVPTVQYWIATELTYDIQLPKNAPNHTSYITVGAYFDYCLSAQSITYNDQPSLLMLSDTRDGFPLHRLMAPVLTSVRYSPITNHHSPISNLRPLVSRAALFDIGIKIAYTISPYNARRHSSRSCHCW